MKAVITDTFQGVGVVARMTVRVGATSRFSGVIIGSLVPFLEPQPDDVRLVIDAQHGPSNRLLLFGWCRCPASGAWARTRGEPRKLDTVVDDLESLDLVALLLEREGGVGQVYLRFELRQQPTGVVG